MKTVKLTKKHFKDGKYIGKVERRCKMTKLKVGEQPARQGDLLLIYLDKLPKGLKKKNNKVLVHSDSTQHDHTLVKGTVYTKGEKIYINVPKDTQIVHTEEHAPVNVPSGVYEVRRQVQHAIGDMVELVVD